MSQRTSVSDGYHTWQEFADEDIFSMLHIHVFCAYRSQLGSAWSADRQCDNRARLYYIQGGEGEVRFQGETFKLTPGHLLLVPANTRHAHRCEGALDIYWCHFAATFHTGVDLFSYLLPRHEVTVSDRKLVRERFERLTGLFSNDTLPALAERTGLVLQLLSPLLATVDRQAFSRRKVEVARFRAAVDYIESHLSESISVGELAAVVHMSPSHFSRRFGVVMGCTPSRYVLTRRVENAQVRLIQGYDTVESIGLELGFRDAAHFSRTFKKLSGISPGRYRELCHVP